MGDTRPNTPPVFENLTEQLVWYTRRFAKFSVGIATDAGIEDALPPINLDELINSIPGNLLSMRVIELFGEYGKMLEVEDVTSIGRVVAILSPAKTADGIIAHVKKFTDFMEANQETQSKFFSYIRLIRKLINGVKDGGPAAK